MKNLYYTVELELAESNDFDYTTGMKDITVYDIDTQSMKLIILSEIRTENYKNSENEIQTWLDNEEDDEEYNFIKL